MTTINEWAARINQCAKDHGFWPKQGRNFGEMIALAHSELSEALEEHRDGMPPVYLKCKNCSHTLPWDAPLGTRPHMVAGVGIWGRLLSMLGRPVPCDGIMKPEGPAVELMDCVIRCLDTTYHLLQHRGISVEEVMETKVSYNEGREYMHGKAY